MAVIVIDQAAHADAPAWYSSHPSEPSGSGYALSADLVVPLTGITLEAVLDTIGARASNGGDVMIVCHARDMGLAIPLVSGGQVRARYDAIGSLSADHASESDGIPMPAMPAAEAAPTLMISETQVATLRRKMNQVRALRLRHVALRGCNVGTWANSLASYKEFFGCQALSGPTLRDTYGTMTPQTTLDLARFQASHAGWHVFVDGSPGGQVAIATQGGDSDEHTYTIAVAAQSPAALADWGSRHLGRPAAGSFTYHGMWQTSAAPGSPRILFIRDADYASHLRVV